MKKVSILLLSLLVPQAFMGITPLLNSEPYVESKNSVNNQTIIVQGDSPTVEREEWLLDVMWPVQEYWKRTSHFGYRYVPNCRFCSRYHQGLDFTPGEGRAIYNIMDGEVVDIGWDGGFGYRAVIRHTIHEDELEYTTIYAHMKPTDISERLQPGDIIPKGTIIGVVGNTGVSTGPHLHFEVHRNENVLDPLEFFSKHLPKTS